MIVQLQRALRCPANEPPLVWPAIEEELKDYRHYFTGRVLNAGAGNRDLSAFVPGELVNQDIAEGLHNGHIHIYSPLHRIPREDGHFDAIICNAVLEHVRNPDEVLQEFHRVLKPGGYLYLCIPFLQPEHLDPADFQRYTKDGLRTLVIKHGFEVEKIEGAHSVYHTLAWIVHEWLNSSSCWSYRLLRRLLYPLLRYKSRHSRVYVDSIASAYRVLARKP
jgi:SAM-dependent methyltransferase